MLFRVSWIAHKTQISFEANLFEDQYCSQCMFFKILISYSSFFKNLYHGVQGIPRRAPLSVFCFRRLQDCHLCFFLKTSMVVFSWISSSSFAENKGASQEIGLVTFPVIAEIMKTQDFCISTHQNLIWPVPREAEWCYLHIGEANFRYLLSKWPQFFKNDPNRVFLRILKFWK